MRIKKYLIVVKKEKNNGYYSYVPDLPGCITQGKTKRELEKNMEDAIKGYLESLMKHNEPIPEPQN